MAADVAPNTRLVRFFAVVGLITAVALLGSAVTTPQIPGWYQGLAKPFWTPPNWLFPIAWTTLYALMGVALLRLWGKPPQTPGRDWAIGLFLAQLAFNAAWSPVFFGLQAPWPALAIIVLLIATLALTIKAARPVDRIAAWLLLPYLVWVCYAFTLNAAIAVMN